jgi:hypothetical protein
MISASRTGLGLIARLGMASLSVLLWLGCGELPQGGDGSLRREGLKSQVLQATAAGQWSTTGSMTQARWFHTATELPDGRVLVVGGGRRQLPPFPQRRVVRPEHGAVERDGLSGHGPRRSHGDVAA